MSHINGTILNLLIEHIEACHDALESEEKNFDTRVNYLGHLAMCSRILKDLYRKQYGELQKIVRVENFAFKMAPPRTRHGDNMKSTWLSLAHALDEFQREIGAIE